MNTASNPPFVIQASYLGPIFSLREELSGCNQNLIFARNGTGKSFLARAFHYLDLHGQGENISRAAFSLVSDEAEDGKGSFSFYRGSVDLATLHLEIDVKADANISTTIFHVFSEDFVQKELREYEFEIQDNIENQISVGSENIEILEKRRELDRTVGAYREDFEALRQKFESEKDSQLVEKAKVRRNLTKYREINFKSLLEQFSDKPDSPDVSFTSILNDLDNLKAIPADPVYPKPVNVIEEGDINLEAIEECLQRITSPSSVSEEIRRKIDAHHEFYKIGAQIIQKENRTECPFCEQGITNLNSKKIIETYINYFADEEESHKSELRNFHHKIKQKKIDLEKIGTQIARQKSHYDDLKQYVPSKRDTLISNAESVLEDACATISTTIELIEQKIVTLAEACSILDCNLLEHITSVNRIIEDNNEKSNLLVKDIQNDDKERIELQRRACDVFGQEFVINNWRDVKNLNVSQESIRSHKEELTALESANPSKDARERVARTFHLLLRRFFADKYIFDDQKFILKRGNREMQRGAHRTLSDGEKTAIAFCWFVACIHRKVKANKDYSKIFLVFDDPVTSMSYDFVFSIAQTLKDLNISDQGEISIDHADIDGNKKKRPELLILTHSSYFFNISRTNRVVKDEATFSLYQDGEAHKIKKLRKYIAPFEEHLKHVFHVSEGGDPSHSTGNAIRSVLEAIGHFCMPDKSESFQDFVTFLAESKDIGIESVLINSLCHGTYYEETPMPEDLKHACKITITVVEHFAPGQLEVIKNNK